jgi:hypothetical protein
MFRGNHSLCGTDRLMAVSNVLKQGLLMLNVELRKDPPVTNDVLLNVDITQPNIAQHDYN